MKKNKLIALGLSALMVASIAGCSTPSTSVDDTKSAESGSDSVATADGEKIFRYSNTADIATIEMKTLRLIQRNSMHPQQNIRRTA